MAKSLEWTTLPTSRWRAPSARSGQGYPRASGNRRSFRSCQGQLVGRSATVAGCSSLKTLRGL